MVFIPSAPSLVLTVLLPKVTSDVWHPDSRAARRDANFSGAAASHETSPSVASAGDGGQGALSPQRAVAWREKEVTQMPTLPPERSGCGGIHSEPSYVHHVCAWGIFKIGRFICSVCVRTHLHTCIRYSLKNSGDQVLQLGRCRLYKQRSRAASACSVLKQSFGSRPVIEVRSRQ